MAAGICDSLNLKVDQPTAVSTRLPQTKATDLNFAVPDNEITDSTPTDVQVNISISL